MNLDFGPWLAQAITSHGYWMLVLGCLLEGETVLLLAGFAAHRGQLDPLWVLVVASVAAFVGDQCFFWLGRRHGARMLALRPAWACQAARVNALLQRWGGWLVIGIRFAYGLRIAGPVVMGASAMPAWRFAAFNAAGAVIWALVVGGLGWLLGGAAEALLGKVQHLEAALLSALLLLALTVAAWRWYRAK